jgi:sporulation protein YlmC with PRC-barrel domain
MVDKYKEAQRTLDKEKNIVRLELRVPAKHVQKVKDFIKELLKNETL